MNPTWRRLSILAGALGALVLTAAVVFSQQPQPPQGPPPGPGFHGRGGPREGFGPFGPFGRELNLTEDQQAQIKKIQESFHDSGKTLHDQMRALHESQPDPMSTEFNEAAVRTAAEARARIQVEMEVSHARMMSQVLGVLSPEQKAQLAARHQQMRHMGAPPRPPRPGEPPM
ncbi:MAG: Spy/CpxP family protein refolding chaperone [Acidobacteriota bacterium]